MAKQKVYMPPIMAVRKAVIMMTQTGTSNPVISILENSINATWEATYSAVGTYILSIDNPLFDPTTTTVNCMCKDDTKTMIGAVTLDGELTISQWTTATNAKVNEVSAQTTIEVTIYNVVNQNIQ